MSSTVIVLNYVIVFGLGMFFGYELVFLQIKLKTEKIQRQIDQFYKDRAETSEVLSELCEVLKTAAAAASAETKAKKNA